MSAEIERILSNMIRMGVVEELDEANARVKIRANGIVTDWIPFPAARAGATRTWSAPRKGEQIALFAPYGDTAQAFAGQSFYQDDHPAPAGSKDQEHTVYPDGTTVDYNSATNTFTMTVAGSAKVIVNCKEATVNAETSVTLNTPLTHCTGALEVDGLLTYKAGMVGSGGGTTASITGDVIVTSGDVKADAISLKQHKTSGVQPGSGTSSVPVP